MKSFITSIIMILLIGGSLHAQRYNYVGGHSTKIVTIAPDLVVTKIKVPYIPPHARMYTGNLIRMTAFVTIRNQGNDLARSGFGIYTNLKLHGKKKAGERISRLSAGQSKTFRMQIYVSDRYNGRTISLTSTVDPPGGGKIPEAGAPYGGLVRESNERNNTRKVHVKLPRFKKVGKKQFPLD